ncbi:MAG: adaptor protein MecA [Lachnospiraceae bacterium]|nr:adaptor protein MecA [Lachnospiraceae bacterium]
MKFKKENDNSITVSISEKELLALGIRLEDLKYGDHATSNFLYEVLFRARIELDFEPVDEGMRTEIIPRADGGVDLIYTFAGEFEETDPRYATFSPYIQMQAFQDYYKDDDIDEDSDEANPFNSIEFEGDVPFPVEEREDRSGLNEVEREDETPASGQETMEDFIRRLNDNGEATATFSIFVDGADISKDANASRSFDRFMNYLSQSSSGSEILTPFKNLISKLRSLSGAKESDVSATANPGESKGIETVQSAESRDAAVSIPATAQEGKKAAPADTKPGRASHGGRSKSGKTAPAGESLLTKDILFVYRFDSFDDACRAAVCAGPYTGANALYKSPAPESAYYLLMHTVGATAHEVNSTCSIFHEFGDLMSRDNPIFESYAKEHFDCLIAKDAILHLREIGG